MNHVRFHGAMRPTRMLRRRNNPYRRNQNRAPFIDWSNPYEVCGVIAAAIGVAVVAGMWASIL